MELFFAARWIMISEVSFDSSVARGNYTAEEEEEEGGGAAVLVNKEEEEEEEEDEVEEVKKERKQVTQKSLYFIHTKRKCVQNTINYRNLRPTSPVPTIPTPTPPPP